MQNARRSTSARAPPQTPLDGWRDGGTTADWQDSADTVNETQIFWFGTQTYAKCSISPC